MFIGYDWRTYDTHEIFANCLELHGANIDSRLTLSLIDNWYYDPGEDREIFFRIFFITIKEMYKKCCIS